MVTTPAKVKALKAAVPSPNANRNNTSEASTKPGRAGARAVTDERGKGLKNVKEEGGKAQSKVAKPAPPLNLDVNLDYPEPTEDDIERDIAQALAEEQPRVDLTEDLIIDRHALDHDASHSSAARASFLAGLTHLRLDRAQVQTLSTAAFQSIPAVTHLYLQHNHLTDMRPLSALPHLRFCSLRSNHIIQVAGISRLPSLLVLDLVDNTIAALAVSELPKSLSILKLEGNPCVSSASAQRKFQQQALTHLPHLRDLDGPIDEDTADQDWDASIHHADQHIQSMEQQWRQQKNDMPGALDMCLEGLDLPPLEQVEDIPGLGHGVPGAAQGKRERTTQADTPELHLGQSQSDPDQVMEGVLNMLDDIERHCLGSSMRELRSSMVRSSSRSPHPSILRSLFSGRPPSAPASGLAEALSQLSASGGSQFRAPGHSLLKQEENSLQFRSSLMDAASASQQSAASALSRRGLLTAGSMSSGHGTPLAPLTGPPRSPSFSRSGLIPLNPLQGTSALAMHTNTLPPTEGWLSKPLGQLRSHLPTSQLSSQAAAGSESQSMTQQDLRSSFLQTGVFGDRALSKRAVSSERVEEQIAADLAMLQSRLEMLIEPLTSAAEILSRGPRREGSPVSGKPSGERGGQGSKMGGKEASGMSLRPTSASKSLSTIGSTPNTKVAEAAKGDMHALVDGMLSAAALRIAEQREREKALTESIHALRHSGSLVGELQQTLSIKSLSLMGKGAVSAIQQAVKEQQAAVQAGCGKQVVAAALSQHVTELASCQEGKRESRGDVQTKSIRTSLARLERLASTLVVEHTHATDAALQGSITEEKDREGGDGLGEDQSVERRAVKASKYYQKVMGRKLAGAKIALAEPGEESAESANGGRLAVEEPDDPTGSSRAVAVGLGIGSKPSLKRRSAAGALEEDGDESISLSQVFKPVQFPEVFRNA